MRMRKDAKIELIRQVPLFAGCSKKQLAEIGTLADELTLPEGTQLIKEGARGHEFFVLVDGEVDVRRKGRKLNTLGNGSFFGEMALVSSLPRSATVTATTPVRVLVVHEQAFRGLLHSSPAIQLKILEALADRVVETASA